MTEATHDDLYGRTKDAYEELFTSRILSLAIAIRTKFYQGMDPILTIKHVQHCALLYKMNGGIHDGPVQFSLKDICDKIIHAELIQKNLNSEIESEVVELIGHENFKGTKRKWSMGISIALLCEGVLNWVDDVQS